MNLDKSPSLARSNSGFGHQRSLLEVKGPKGQVRVELAPFVQFQPNLESFSNTTLTNSELLVNILDDRIPKQKAFWGLSRQLVNNAIIGVTQGHQIDINLVGVGFRAQLDDEVEPLPLGAGTLDRRPGSKRLNMKLGFSHPVLVDVPDGLEVEILSPTNFIIKGSDKQAVCQFAASIRKWRKPEPYNGKGVFVGGETIKRKEVRKR